MKINSPLLFRLSERLREDRILSRNIGGKIQPPYADLFPTHKHMKINRFLPPAQSRSYTVSPQARLGSSYRAPLPSQTEEFARFRSLQSPFGRFMPQRTQPAYQPSRQPYGYPRHLGDNSTVSAPPMAHGDQLTQRQIPPTSLTLGAPQSTRNQELVPPSRPLNQNPGVPLRQPMQFLPPRPLAPAYQAEAGEETDRDPLEDRKVMDDIQDESETYYADNQFDEIFAGFVGVESVCSHCHSAFPSKTLLHKHLKGCSVRPAQSHRSLHLPLPTVSIVESTSLASGIGTGFGFRGWSYASVLVALTPGPPPDIVNPDALGCLDTGCAVTLIDRERLARLLPDQPINKMATPLSVRGIGSSKHETGEYVCAPLYLIGTKDDDSPAYACLRRELHLVDGLKANMLIGNDIIGPEGILIDISKGSVYISSCGIKLMVDAKQRGPFIRREILAESNIVLPPHSERLIPFISPNLPDDRDFIFHPSPAPRSLTFFSHLIDRNNSAVVARNDSDHAFQVPRKFRLGAVTEMYYENCYLSGLGPEHAECPPIHAPPILSSGVSISAVDPALETRLSNEIMVYGEPEVVSRFKDLTEEFPSIWTSQGFVDIPPKRWMTVPLRSDWESKVSEIKPRVYPLGHKARKVVNETFDKLQSQGRLEYTRSQTPFSFPVFVVWKTNAKRERKGRAVVDIRKLNDMVIPDSYSLPLQSEIIANVHGYSNLAVLDAASFFYMWRLHPDHRFMFTVMTHRGQETFKVPIMGFINSITYVQREIDTILRAVRDWARAYIDDIICGATSVEDLLQKLRILFEIFVAKNISIQPTKTYLNYPDVGLLGQRINSLGLATADDKLKAIRLLKYPDTLGALEYYLGLTGYLRSYVHFYAQLAEPLHSLKTSLLKGAPIAGPQRRSFASKTKLPLPTRAEDQQLNRCCFYPGY